ncbi:MAG TPA: hypothetical protein VFA18_23855 [Gemmataceae bacterium]|nr:hypothetical protein [Gemmataceae bacterium]
MPDNTIRVCQAGDHTRVQVPWAKADAWQSHFQKLGVIATLCLDPVAQEACLELRGVSAGELASMMPPSL